MTKSVIITIFSTETGTLPEGKAFAGFLFKLTPTDSNLEPASLTTLELSATFTDAAPGEYTASVEAVDLNGEPLSVAQTTPVFVPSGEEPLPTGATLPSPPTNFLIPGPISVTIS